MVSREFVSRLGWFSTEMYMRFKLHACSSLFSTPPPFALFLSLPLSSGILSQLQAQKHSLPSLFSLIISLAKETAKKRQLHAADMFQNTEILYHSDWTKTPSVKQVS